MQNRKFLIAKVLKFPIYPLISNLLNWLRYIVNIYLLPSASLVAQLVKNSPAVWETWVQSLGWEDPLEKGKATHSRILAWRIPWTVQSLGSQSQTGLSDFVSVSCSNLDVYLSSWESLSLSLVAKSYPILETLWTVACQAPLSIGFSRQENWSGLLFPSPSFVVVK